MRATIALSITALCCASTARAQTDFTYSPIVPGTWSYRVTNTGSEARFVDSRAVMRLTVACMRTTRRVNISLPYPAAVPSLSVWTSSAVRSLATRHLPAMQQLIAEIPAYDSLLDAIVFSRGRFAVTVPGAAPLVVPAWPEAMRIIEDCRT